VKRFLGANWSREGSQTVGVFESATDALAGERSRTSPLFPAKVDATPACLGEAGAIAFLLPRSPTEVLAILVNDKPVEIQDATYITHGHACAVVLLPSLDTARELVDSLDGLLLGSEIWPYADGQVDVGSIDVRETTRADWDCPAEVSTDGIGFEAGAQIRQFNANIELFTHIARRIAPELQELIAWLGDSVADLAGEIRELTPLGETSDAAVRKVISNESVIVELNAVLTLYCSQVASGSLPLSTSSFPVGEYSLLGIGGMIRAAWRIYSHINQVFSTFDHVGKVQRRYREQPSFDPIHPTQRVDFTVWEGHEASFTVLKDDTAEPARIHIPYFSSRWGFHEALHSISVSWQCLHASATKEWNLLTLTHEYLHSHVRDLLAEFLNVGVEPDGMAKLLDRVHRKEHGANAFESMQVAYVEALAGIRAAERLAGKLVPGVDKAQAAVPANISAVQLIQLRRDHAGLVDEIIVHVLDFLYFYAGDTDAYVNSIWSSWSLVPSVNDQIELYVLRTLCALAATSPEQDPQELFADVTARLAAALAPLATRDRTRPAIGGALELLADDQSRKRLDARFIGARYVAKLASCFFYDAALNAALVRDETATIGENGRTYALTTGDYRGEVIESPVGFLLDRFEAYSDQAGSDGAEYESVWQLLQLI
jgi:hypothetical protein